MSETNGAPEKRGEFDFDDLAPVAIPVWYRKKEYVLREADEPTAIAFRNCAARAGRYNDGKMVGIDGVGEIQVVLLLGCLFEVYDDKGTRKERPITSQDLKGIPGKVRGWEARVVTPLFQKAKEISGLGEPETRESLEKQLKEIQDKLAKLSPPAKPESSESGQNESPELTEATSV